MAEYAPVQETLAAPAGPPIDPDVLDQRRKLAQALIAQAMGGEPIGSWTQGLANLAQALMGGYNVRKTNQQEAAGRASGAADTAAALEAIMAGGGGGGGGSGETADEPGTEPVSSAPTSDVEAYIRQSASKRGIDPNVAVRVARSEGLAPGVWQSNVRRNGQRETSYGPYQLLVGGGLGDKFIRQTGLNPRDPSTVKAQVDFALDQARQGGWSPWYGAGKVGVGNWTGINRGGGGGETAALPNVDPVSAAPTPDVAAFLGTGTRAGPDYVPAPAPIGRGATAQPVPGTPMPTRPTVTGYPAIAAALQAPPANYDPTTMPRPASPPDALGRTTPGATGPYAMPQPIPQGGHTLMAQQPPAPLPQDNGLALLDPSAVPFSVDAPAPLASVAVPPQSPRDRAVQAIVQAQGRTDAPILASADIPALPRARPTGPLPSMPPGQQAAPLPPEHPLARTPQPRPAPAPAPATAAAAPAATASVPQRRRAPIFREPYPSVLSAQEFARQGQNYLTGRPSFADQQAASPAQPRRGLLQALLGRGGPQAPAAAQAAPAGSPVAAGGAAAPAVAPASSRVSALLANPYVDSAIKTAVLARLMPKDKPYITAAPGATVFDPNTGKAVFTAPGKPAGQGDYGLTPVYGTDAQGNPVILQLSKDGNVKQVQTPAGVTLSTGVDKIDSGTHFTLIDKKNGNVIGILPKDVAGEAAQKEEGTAQGKAKVNLDTALANSDRMINTIDSVLNDPALAQATGPIQSQMPTLRGSTARVESKLAEIKGGAFLQAYDALRGAGAITEREGAAASAAYHRLQSTNMGDADYVEALQEFRTEVGRMMNIARQKAGQSAAPVEAEPASLAAPSPEAKTQFSDDEVADIPEGRFVKDDQGNRFKKQDGKLVPVQ